MITIRQDSRVFTLLTLLSYVGEFPLSSIHLLGSKEAWRKLIHQLTIPQAFRFPDSSDRINCKLLLVTGKGKSKSIRLSKSAVSILERLNPEAAQYYSQIYLRHNHSGDEKRAERFHRVAESVSFLRQAGYESCPYQLPTLQLYTIRKVVPDEPSFYISHELKHIGDDDVNKISFSRITGAIFYPGGCYAVYNSRDYLMKWNGRGESKTRLILTEIARMNAMVEEVTSAILLGRDYSIAELTLRSLNGIKRAEMRFDSNYDRLHFIPMDQFGARLVNILTLPDWNENLLSLLFDDANRADGNNTFDYDALEDGVYVLSFLDSDIIRLNRFRDAVGGRKAEIICFPEQVVFLRSFLGSHIRLRTVTMDSVEEALQEDWSDANE